MSTAAPAATTDGRDWTTIVALVVLTVVLTLIAGLGGTLAGVATAIVWVGVAPPYAIAAGCLLLAAAGIDGTSLGTVAVIGGVFLVPVVVPTVRDGQVRVGAVTIASAGGFIGLGWVLTQSQPLWIAAGTLVGVSALAAYLLHRYERVRLGLVPEETPSNTQTHDP